MKPTKEMVMALTPNERMAVAASITLWRDEGHEGKAVLLESVLGRFPKPAPTVKTNEELATLAMNMNESWEVRHEACLELVGRANGSKP